MKDQGVIWVHSNQKEIPGVIEPFQKIHTLSYIDANGTEGAAEGGLGRMGIRHAAASTS
jgi:hypothetical protein